MKRALMLLVLGVVLGMSGIQLAESAPAAPSSTLDGTQGTDFVAWLNGQQEPLPAAACTTSVRCYSTGQLLACSGSTSCYKFLGCYVVCDDVQYDCPPGGPFACP